MKKNVTRLVAQEQSFFWAAPALIWQVIFLYVPVAVILGMSVLHRLDYPIWNHLSFEQYRTIIDPLYFYVIGRSLLLAITNALFCLAFAYPVAYFVALYARLWKKILLLLLVLPFWTNFLVQVYAWFFVLERHGFVNTLLQKLHIISEPLRIINTSFAIQLVMLFCYLPFMIMPIYTTLEKINKKLIEASYDLGANPWQTFVRITLPLSLSGVRTGFFLVFIPSFGEFVIPSLLGGGKTLYVGTLVSHFFVESKNMHLGAAFTCLSAFVLGCACILIVVLFRTLYRFLSSQGSR